MSTNGQQKEAKKFKDDTCACKEKCRSKVDVEIRQKLFEQFYGLGDLMKQKLFLFSLMDFNEIKRRSKNSETNMKRSQSIIYYLRPYDNNAKGKVKVCADFFAKTFGLNLRTIQRWAVDRNPQTMQHKKTGKTREKNMDSLTKFLDSYKFYLSHYTRSQNIDKRYLPIGYSIKKFYEDYIQFCSKNNYGTSLSMKSFYEFIQLNTNISAHVPQKDTCSTCDQFSRDIQIERNLSKRRDLISLKENHLNKAELARSMLNTDKSNADDQVII